MTPETIIQALAVLIGGPLLVVLVVLLVDVVLSTTQEVQSNHRRAHTSVQKLIDEVSGVPTMKVKRVDSLLDPVIQAGQRDVDDAIAEAITDIFKMRK